MNRSWWRSLLVVGVVLVVILAACSSDGGNDSDGTGGDGTAEGFVSIHGSSTVEPITSLVAEDFAAANDGFDYEVGAEGTGAGFQEFFCAGDSDISDASRQINEDEIALCADAGVEYVELPIAYDGITLLTSPDNADVTCLSFLDLYALLGPESEGFENWSDANDLAAELEAELGGEFGAASAPYPDLALDVVAPGEESGTFDSFVGDVIEPIGEARGLPEEEWTTRPDYTASPNDNVIIEGIQNSEGSLGWVGFGYYEQNLDTTKAIEVDGGDGCIAPSPDVVRAGDYPISRLLYVYVNAASITDNPAVVPFVDFYLGDDGMALVPEAGYVNLTEEELSASRSAWEEAK